MGCVSSTNVKQSDGNIRLKMSQEERKVISKELDKIIKMADKILEDTKGVEDEKLFKLEDQFETILTTDVNIVDLDLGTLFQILSYAEITRQNADKILRLYKAKVNDLIEVSVKSQSEEAWCVVDTGDPSHNLGTEFEAIRLRWPQYLNQRLNSNSLVRLPSCTCFKIDVLRASLMSYKNWKKMPRNQLIKPELHSSRVCDFPSFFVSHRWETKEDPDPRGLDVSYHSNFIKAICNTIVMCSQLMTSKGDDWLYDVLRKFKVCPIHVSYWFLAMISLLKPMFLQRRPPRTVAIMYYLWYDYTCLPQAPRTVEEESFFKSSLDNLQEIQGKMITYCVGNLDYFDRLWCYVEYLNSDLIIGANGSIIQDKDRHEKFTSWITDCDETGTPNKLKTLTITNGSDKKPIINMMKRSITFKTQVMKSLVVMCGMDISKIKRHQHVMDYYEMDLNEMIKEIMF